MKIGQLIKKGCRLHPVHPFGGASHNLFFNEYGTRYNTNTTNLWVMGSIQLKKNSFFTNTSQFFKKVIKQAIYPN
jgi:hypothetical protein